MDENEVENGNGFRLGLFACSACEKTFDNLAGRIRHYSSEHLNYKANNNHIPAKPFLRRIQQVCKIPPTPKAVDNEEKKSGARRKITCQLEREAKSTAMASTVDDLNTSFDAEEVTMVAIDPQGEKPSSCPYCPLMFSMCSTMKKHLETVHPKSAIQSSNFHQSQHLCKLDDDDGEQQLEDPAANIPIGIQTVEWTNEKESSASTEMNSQDTNRSIGKQFTCFICKDHFSTPESFKGHLLKSYKVTEETATCLIASFYHTHNNVLGEDEDNNVIKVDPDDIMIVSEIVDLTLDETTSFDFKLLLGSDIKPDPSLNTEYADSEKRIAEASTCENIADVESPEDHDMESDVRSTPDRGEKSSREPAKRRRSAKKQQPTEKKPYKCQHCPRRYYHDSSRRNHIKQKHPVMLRKSSRKKAQKTSAKLSSPEKSILMPIPTPGKTRNRKTRREISSGLSRSNAGSVERRASDFIGEQCKLCFENFTNKDALRSHLRSYHNLSDSAVISIGNDIDGSLNSTTEVSEASSTTKNHSSPVRVKQIQYLNCLKKEENFLENAMDQNEKNVNQSEDHQCIGMKLLDRMKTLYKCDLCDRVFRNKYLVLRHRRVHTGEKPYQCSLCSKAFARADNLKLHIQGVHGVKVRPSRKRKGMKTKRI